MINVLDHGVAGNGSTDDTNAIQNLIDSYVGTLCFPTGKYRITRTLHFRPETGYHIVGCGMAQRAHCDTTMIDDAPTRGARSALIWDGASTTDPMVQIEGTGLIWDGLTLWGSYATSDKSPNPECQPTGKRPAIGIKICNSCASSSSSGQPTLTRAGKIWFNQLMIEDCVTAIKAEGSTPVESCAFGYFQPRECDVAVELAGTASTMFTFRFVLPSGTPSVSRTIFKVSQGGRIYVAAMNMLGNGTILDVQNGGVNDAFYHINGLKVDGNSNDLTVLNNVDSGDGLQLFRFTDVQFQESKDVNSEARVVIDRRGGTGQTVLEFVGSRWLTLNGQVLTDNVLINGASSSKRSRLIVRDSTIGRIAAERLIQSGSLNFSEHRIKNWLLASGVDFSVDEQEG
jgi:hypothetical protein